MNEPERWVDGLIPDSPVWARDLIDSALRHREHQLSQMHGRLMEAERLLREARDAGHLDAMEKSVDAFLGPRLQAYE